MPELNLGQNYQISEDSNGHLVVRDRQSDTVVARHHRDDGQWNLAASTAAVVGLDERSSAPDGEENVRKLYAKGSDGNIYKLDPDGSEQRVGGAGELADLSDVYKQSDEPSDPSDDDVWFVTR
mgnify:CR=1 FL=1